MKICQDCGHNNDPRRDSCKKCGGSLSTSISSVASDTEIPAGEAVVDVREVASINPEKIEPCETNPLSMPVHSESEQENRRSIPVAKPKYLVITLPNGSTINAGSGFLLGRASNRVDSRLLAFTGIQLSISRAHAWLGVIAGSLVVVDLNSKYGTLVNNQAVPCGGSLTFAPQQAPVRVTLANAITLEVNLSMVAL